MAMLFKTVLIILASGPLWAQGYLEVLSNKELMLEAQCKAIAALIWKWEVTIHSINQMPKEKIVNPLRSELFHASLRGFIMRQYFARSLKSLKARSRRHENLTSCACICVVFKWLHSSKRLSQGSFLLESQLATSRSRGSRYRGSLLRGPSSSISESPSWGGGCRSEQRPTPHRGAQLWVPMACAKCGAGDFVCSGWRGPCARDELSVPFSPVCWWVCHRVLCD